LTGPAPSLLSSASSQAAACDAAARWPMASLPGPLSSKSKTLHMRDQPDVLADIRAQPGLGPDVEEIKADPHARLRGNKKCVVEGVNESEVGIQPVGRLDGQSKAAIRRVADEFAHRIRVGNRARVPVGRGAGTDKAVHDPDVYRRREVDVLSCSPQ